MDSLEPSSETAYKNESFVHGSSNSDTTKDRPTRNATILASVHRSIRKLTWGKNDEIGFSDEYQSAESSKQSLKLSMLVVLVYLLLGTITYTLWMNWSVVDALYFTAVTFTTIGYGDITPDGGIGIYVFTTIFVLLGITVLGGIALTIIFDRLFSLYEEISERTKSNQHSYFIKLFDTDAVLDEKENKSIGSEAFLILRNNKLLLVGLLAPSLVIGYFEGWSLLKSLYFCTITATTVGYGDVSPQSTTGRLIAVFYLPLCVAIMTNILGQISGLYMKQKAQAQEDEFLSRNLTLKDLAVMDTTGNGSVSYSEFLSFMLVTMGKVDRNDVNEIETLYKQLDKDHNGKLSIDDLFGRACSSTRNLAEEVV